MIIRQLGSEQSKNWTRSLDIITVAMFTFGSQHTDLYFGALMAVLALDHDFALGVLVHAASALHQKLYHWQALVFRCILTKRALLIVKSERFKAVSMHLMAAP